MGMIQDAAAKFTNGVQQLQAGNLEGAVAAFSEAIMAFPQFEPAFRMRAEAYRSLGQAQAANADLQAVITITRARLQEAERSLTGSSPAAQAEQPQTSGSAVGGVASGLAGVLAPVAAVFGVLGAQSPIILWTIIGTVVLVMAALVLLVVAGG